jgi:DNA polymerase III epsilon subunit-like protein
MRKKFSVESQRIKMTNLLKYLNFINEHKFWGKSISDFLEWIDSKSDKHWIFFDSETTGLPSDPYEIQLTQVSCTVTKYDPRSNKFTEIEAYNRKLKLTQKTLDTIKSGKSRIKSILSFNRYGQSGIEFHDERETLSDFSQFIEKWDNPILVIQNAEFDMRFLNTRGSVKFKNEVIDTKQVLQLFYLPLIQKLAESDESYRELIQKIGTSSRDGGLISSSMGKIGPALGINMSGYHDALTDCRLAMEMFRRVVDTLKLNMGVDISKYQGERINKIR